VAHWVRFRIGLLVAIIAFLTVASIIWAGDSLDKAKAGASLNFAVGVGGLMLFLVFMLTELQARMNIVERLAFYIKDIPREPEWNYGNVYH